MTYIVSSSEKTRGIASDYETKALLYLLNYRNDSSEIDKFVIDFFNDVTGINDKATKAWDVQSKGTKKSSPYEIGKELVTLFKNYISDLEFDYYILFMGGVSNTLRINNENTVFNLDNIKEKAIIKLKEGLIAECKKRNYIDKRRITDNNINCFLKKVFFVIDDKTKAQYIRNLIRINEKYIPSDGMLESIFNEIRDLQSSKKNNKSVEGIEIDDLSDAFNYDRSIESKQIRLLILNTFMNYDIMQKSTPNSFYKIIENYDEKHKKDIIEECKHKIATVLFDKANSDSFWDLLNIIYDSIYEKNSRDIIKIYNLIKRKGVYINSKLDVLSLKYLISIALEAAEI